MTLARWRAIRYYGMLREIAPEDWGQCVAIGEHCDMTEMGRQMRALATALGMRRRYNSYRSERSRISDIERPPDTRPSRAKLRTGYRHDSARHSTARMTKVSAERRREIAQAARAAQLRRKG